MGLVYPRAPEVKAVPTPVNAVLCAAKIIVAKEAGTPKAEAIGFCLAGSDDVAGFDFLWAEVDAQVIKARAVSPSDYDTVDKFKSAISVAASLLNATKWYNGLKAELGAANYTELAAKVEGVVEVAKEL